MPVSLQLYLAVLIIEAAIRGGQEEVFIPPILAETLRSYCAKKLPLSCALVFSGTIYRKIILRELDPQFCERCFESLEQDFNEFIQSPQCENLTRTWRKESVRS